MLNTENAMEQIMRAVWAPLPGTPPPTPRTLPAPQCGEQTQPGARDPAHSPLTNVHRDTLTCTHILVFSQNTLICTQIYSLMCTNPQLCTQTHTCIHTPAVADFILGGSKITADGDCSHGIKRRLLLGRKVMTNLDSIFKSRDIILSTKVHLVKAMVFPVVKYGCESWTVKKAERRRSDAFELWCWRRLFESPLDCKEIQPVHPKGDQSWVFIGRTEVEAETPKLWPPHAKS